MKKLFFTLLLFPTFIFAQTKSFVINGNIAGLPDGQVKITSTQGDQVITTAASKGGVFTLKGSVTEPTLYWITFGQEQPQYLFLDNSSIKITGSKKDIKNIKIEGSPVHKDFLDFQRIFNPIIGELNGFAALLQQTTDAAKKQGLMKQYDSVVKKLNQEVGKFVAAKKSSFVSPFLLQITAQVSENPAELEKRFKMLDEKIRNSETGKNLGNYIAYQSVGALGSTALDFSQNDPSDRPVTLSSFRGKYVLVDFWASWCRPCRIENPNLVKAYNKFKNKNFTVLGVSLDQQKDKWLEAIEKDNLKWTQVSDLKLWNNAVAVMYHVQSIPQNFLVDPAGKIVAKDLRGEELEKKLCELLGCK